jgi:phenylacetate-CoA ligase
VLKGLYPLLPPALKSVAASLHGYRLQARRYGRETEELVEKSVERETWSEDRWTGTREERLAFVLHRAATTVPYYREQWAARRRRGDRSSWERLENWPILSKQEIRDQPHAFLAEDRDSDRLYESSTSGTTGTPLRLWHSREVLLAWYALVEARLRRWNGVSLGDRWAQMGGQIVTPIGRRRPPFWVWNSGMRQLYMSAYHLAPGAAAEYVEAMRHYAVRYLVGYPSAIHALASGILEGGLEAPRLEVAISNAEPLLGYQRAAIGRAFGCPVRDTYGQAEIVCGASECSAGSMHLWPEVGVTEWMRDDADETVDGGQPGRMICTTLLNSDTPLIRYAIGDRSALATDERPCACGRALPRIRSFDGRTADLMIASDGTSVGVLDTVFEADMPIREAQIIQESLRSIRIRVVPAPGFGDRHRESLAHGIRLRMGPSVEVPIETVATIPRTKAGKFQVQVSLLDPRNRPGSS